MDIFGWGSQRRRFAGERIDADVALGGLDADIDPLGVKQADVGKSDRRVHQRAAFGRGGQRLELLRSCAGIDDALDGRAGVQMLHGRSGSHLSLGAQRAADHETGDEGQHQNKNNGQKYVYCFHDSPQVLRNAVIIIP